jgi:hypothetical protein
MVTLSQLLLLLIKPAGEGGSVWHRLPIHFEVTLEQVDEPVLLNARCGVQGTLAVAVIDQRGLGTSMMRLALVGRPASLVGVSRATMAISGSGSEVNAGKTRGIWIRRWKPVPGLKCGSRA